MHGHPGEPGVRLQEIEDLVLHQVGAWPDTLTEVGATVAQAIGTAQAPAPGRAVSSAGGTALRVEPLKWWLLGAEPASLDAEMGATLDLSHSRTRILLSGPEAPVCLSRLLPIDLRQDHFPVARVASGGIHHVGVTLWHSEAGYQLFLPRGFAQSLWEILVETAEQFGLEII
jgi:heterotetrameric sarcosine oxidase gamma subunit|tara:strand:- start:203 stop:718 length:516 start_codon:yes stop_codon:yes gene_type:complete